MSIILEKRNSLERYIREQVCGPGVNGYRFIDLEDVNLVGKDLMRQLPIDYENEIIDIVPAAVYSTGILFPEDKTSTGSIGNAIDNNEQTLTNEGEEDSTQDNSADSIDSSDSIEINQLYPRTMGFTCCLSEECLNERIIEIKVLARYYKKIEKEKDGKFYEKFGLLCEIDPEAALIFIGQEGLESFGLKKIGENAFLTLKKLNNEQYAATKNILHLIQKSNAEALFDKASTLIQMPQLKRETCYMSNLKSTIYYELKNKITDNDLRRKLYDITQEIEIKESVADHLQNLLDAYSGSYGLWQSNPLERIVRIENIDFQKSHTKKSFLYNKSDYSEKIKVLLIDGTEISEGLRDVYKQVLDGNSKEYASLSLNIQLSRDSRIDNSNIFLKVQLVNTSTAYDETKQNDNRYYSTFNELVNRKSFFGVKISFTNRYLLPYNSVSIDRNVDGLFNEDKTTKFIYRQYRDYGIGHGCSVKWDEGLKIIETEYIPSCETPDVDPRPRNKKGKAISDDDGIFWDPLFLEKEKAQEFKWLSIFSDASDTEVTKGLDRFVKSYGDWISQKRGEYLDDSEYKEIACQELDKCQADYQRMKNNIDSLLAGKKNRENLESFRLMNAAMFMQLWHSVKVKKNEVVGFFDKNNFSGFDFDFYRSKADDRLFSTAEPASWRAFQLAFILLNLDGIFRSAEDKSWERRNEWVDLVWFPTGGGKTEAYLGLIALTIINRRKVHGLQGGGTASLMRYTLRLLTMQQFQRATLLIMALELIRRWGKNDLGIEPIYIGFWVGNDSIPNRLTYNPHDTDKDSLQYEFEKILEGKENKVPFSNCPWCNSKLKPYTTKVNEPKDIFNFNRLHLYCDNNNCSFTEADYFLGNPLKGPIPVNLCDESIYQHPPSLLFGTVDKFAQLAHKINGTSSGRNADSRRLFGVGNWEEGKPKSGYLPPDLIIQDELHLLLGPLGSAVALFESAIDQLCTREDGTRPKIISSTATTRNTELQIAALFDRKVDLFPKPGVECDDSFFSFYKRSYINELKDLPVYISKRKYLGILPTGRTQIWMQMRLAAILMTHRAVFELKQLANNSPIDFDSYKSFSKAMDYYHTIISYFNSLKEVGKTQSQIQSYILKELRRVFARTVRPRKLMHSIYTYGPIQESELTGRLSGEDVKNELKNVERKWSARNRFAHFGDEELVTGNVPPEFLVATNMISVGIDVSRFNTIIMNSMPRNTAEYIQASSRIARETYGLVITVHHPFRARDVSHFESFIEFHEKMYSYVEPISITPFTQKAVERYLALYLATMIRHKSRFVERNSAADISTIQANEIKILIDGLAQYFERRKGKLASFNKSIRNLLKDDDVKYIERWINAAIGDWKNECDRVLSEKKAFVFNNRSARAIPPQEQLYVDIEEYEGNIHSKKWQVPMSLRVIEPEAAVKINLK